MVRCSEVVHVVLAASLTWAVWLPAAEAGSALRGPQPLGLGMGDSPELMLEELGRMVGGLSVAEVEGRVVRLEEAMQPIFKALPRSVEGRLEASAVRYLLHRHFIDDHGWFLQGTERPGKAANNSLVMVLLDNQGTHAFQTVLTERLTAAGLSLREVAMLAVAMEGLVHKETIDRLHATYRILDLSQDENHTSESNMELVTKTYMQIYGLGLDHEIITRDESDEAWKDIYKDFPEWDDFVPWFREIRREVLATIPDQRVSFHGAVQVFDEISHRYGRWQDQLCLRIKDVILRAQTPGTGRVPLGVFYKTSLPGGWIPSESPEYLRHMGALDETQPKQPSLIIPNYFDSPSNCGRPSRFYSVCCISECEGLLGHLERTLGTPDAMSQRIVEIVEKLPSSTVEAPRSLPKQLVQRLDGIAAMHGGHAPLHGRLFRQWMHHAFPSECSFPQLSSNQGLFSEEEFQEATGFRALLTDEETKQMAELYAQVGEASATNSSGVVTADTPKDPTNLSDLVQAVEDDVPHGVAEAEAMTNEASSITPVVVTSPLVMGSMEDLELPWLEEEELFISRPVPAKPKEGSGVSLIGLVRFLLMVAMAGSMARALMKMLVSARVSRASNLPVKRKDCMA
jgi:hypothetical protein